MKVSICHATRERPEIAYETALAWLTRQGEKFYEPDYWFAIEVGEAALYAPVLEKLQKQFGALIKVRFVDGKRINYEDVISPDFQFPPEEEMMDYLIPTTKGNAIIKDCGADWVIAMSDNFYPPENWNGWMYPTFKENLGLPVVVGYPYEKVRTMLSHPILTKEFFEWNDNSIFYRGYYHTHADVDLFLKARLSKTLRFLPEGLNPEHRHPYHGAAVAEDKLCILNNSKKTYKQGEAVWQRRQIELSQQFGAE